MYKATCSVLETIIEEGKGTQKAEVDSAYDNMTSFEFVLILHLMIEILSITNDLCLALQSKSIDILNAMNLVSKTKILMQKRRDNGWKTLLEDVLVFCNIHVEVPDMDAHYSIGRGRFRQPKDRVTNEHYFRVDVFIAAVDSQLQELNCRFKDDMIELLSLSSSLDPKRKYVDSTTEDVCKLATKYYPADFSQQEKLNLKYQLELFVLEIKEHPQLDKLKSIADVCQWLAKSEKCVIHYLVDRLVHLILTLPVSTATAERAFQL